MWSFKAFSKQPAVRAILASIFIFLCVVTFSVFEKQHELDNLICKATLQINYHHAVFRGVVEYKTGQSEGVVNLSGYVIAPDKQEYTVQRTVLFTRANYGITPLWESRRIVVSGQESAPPDVLKNIIPEFYLQPSEVTDVDVVPLSRRAHLILKSGVPYLYCNTYTLTTR